VAANLTSSRSLSRRNGTPGFLPAERLSEVFGVILMALALMVAVSLLTHSASDPAWYFRETSSRPRKTVSESPPR
jgi:hypothetical protein